LVSAIPRDAFCIRTICRITFFALLGVQQDVDFEFGTIKWDGVDGAIMSEVDMRLLLDRSRDESRFFGDTRTRRGGQTCFSEPNTKTAILAG
jgi:hypothetical protein